MKTAAQSTTSHHDKREVPSEFNRIAKRYDVLTGLNPGYKKHLRWSAQRLAQGVSPRLLDLCCGTGLSTAALLEVYPDASIDAVDGSQEMLVQARTKPWPDHVRFIQGDANALDQSELAGNYDAILMAYGIRNLTDSDAALASVLRLLRPGGVVCFHEYSVADSPRSQFTWRAVAGAIIIPSGWITSPGSNIYRYLRDSVLAFDGVKAFEARLQRAGFVGVETLPMDGWQRGIVHSFLARRPASAEVAS